MAALQRDPSAPAPREEVLGPTIDSSRSLPIPKISYGLPFDQAIINHVGPDARAYILASKTLAEKTNSLDRLRKALGNRVKGVRVGMTSHTMFHECLEVLDDAKSVQADTLITLGGGSLADAAKYVCKALVNKIDTLEGLVRFANRDEDAVPKDDPPDSQTPTATLICIPTSLSAGEHTPFSGITDAKTQQKYQIRSTQASVVILDPWLALDTPLDIWLQSGVRGIDHAVEDVMSPAAFQEVYDVCLAGLKLLIPGLYDSLHDPNNTNVEARLNAQIGVALTIMPIIWYVPAGASHGIGHMMGPMGVKHGETSCILLPAVCKYNASVTQERQAVLRKTLWEIPVCRDIFAARDLEEDVGDLGDLLDAVIRGLGMPRTLKERGIVGAKVQALAKMSLNDKFLKTNPIPITTEEQVMEILDMSRG